MYVYSHWYTYTVYRIRSTLGFAGIHLVYVYSHWYSYTVYRIQSTLVRRLKICFTSSKNRLNSRHIVTVRFSFQNESAISKESEFILIEIMSTKQMAGLKMKFTKSLYNFLMKSSNNEASSIYRSYRIFS
jgi:hypothetical protein